MAETLSGESNRIPITLKATHLSNIFSVKFDSQNRRVISAGKSKIIILN